MEMSKRKIGEIFIIEEDDTSRLVIESDLQLIQSLIRRADRIEEQLDLMLIELRQARAELAGKSNEVKDAIQDLKLSMDNGFSDLKQTVLDGFSDLKQTVLDGFSDLKQTMLDGFSDLKQTMLDGFSDLKQTVLDGFSGVNEGIDDLKAHLQALTTNTNIIARNMSELVTGQIQMQQSMEIMIELLRDMRDGINRIDQKLS